MSTDTMSLSDFLLARIAEDEELCRMNGYDLAWCEAHRRIVELWSRADSVAEAELDGPYSSTDGAEWDARADSLEKALRALALPYADHPDYREEWRA